ncbi:NAD(P)-dependent oxidoreductase [Bacteroides faecichinchillae]|uniref:UDP-glucose 4-epimerase n=1 Tax=Bacteroides faecichinchillae TaxID=871325 RepID=A0A1M5FZA5_9BACE|nr:NAD(P)-dependent oxidoreductase [Bacteroides faecichinchillae]THG56673.1 NAD(P)-dependent oxidoreductase [Bacteroides faecichinchillae]SHF96808.1 UDP-glucose 4-epimerase [Bacteroides faecichinchillae]
MILLVGATGYLGRYLSVYLKELGYDILALGRSKAVQTFFEENQIPFQFFDITDESSYLSLPKDGVEAIVCLSACLAEHETPVHKFFDINTLGVYKLLEYARMNGINKFILTSSHKVYNDIDKLIISEADGISFRGDHSPYIISKIAAENFVQYYQKDFGIQGIVLRLTGVHGYGEILGHLNTDGSYKKSTFELFFERILEGKKIEVWGDQTIKRDHIYIKDVLSAIKASIDTKDAAGIYTIASGIGYSQYDEAKALNEVFGNNKSEIELHPEKPGLTRGYVYSIDKAKNELLWKPQYTDIVTLYSDYKKEWESKRFHNYHFIKEADKPKTL